MLLLAAALATATARSSFREQLLLRVDSITKAAVEASQQQDSSSTASTACLGIEGAACAVGGDGLPRGPLCCEGMICMCESEDGRGCSCATPPLEWGLAR